MRHVAAESDYRFSDDVHVSLCTINATLRRETNLENPYHDRDWHKCGDSKVRAEEAEITAEDLGTVNFPSAGVTYYTNLYFMRWACNNQSQNTGCIWDPDGGTASYTESISEECTGIFCDDKWNTVPGEFAPLGTKGYAYASSPYGFSSANFGSTDNVGASWGAQSPSSAPASAALEAFTLVRANDGELHIRPDLSNGLNAYASLARQLGREVALRGPSRGVVTFVEPLSQHQIEELANIGIRFVDVEAVSTPAADGTRWTVGDAYGVDLRPAMNEIAAEFDVEFLGIVSAEVIVPNRQVFDAALERSEIWLIDLSIEQVGRSHPGTEVSQNDLYWRLAGW